MTPTEQSSPETADEDRYSNTQRRRDDLDTAVVLDAFSHDDPDLAPEEKETTFRFARDEDEITFFTAEAGIGRRLIAHPETVLDEVILQDNQARPSVDPAEVSAEDSIVGVRGRLPIGVLLIRASPRSASHHAAIVTERVFEEVDRP